MKDKTVRIAGVQGFYGDSPMGAMQVVATGSADYLVQDALAELTLSILQKDRMRDPTLGYARDIELLAKTVYPAALHKGIKIVTNSGGLNPRAAALRLRELLTQQGLKAKKIAVVTGDDFLPRLQELKDRGFALTHMETGERLDLSAVTPTHANVYIGGAPVKIALDNGADIVITGRVADPCLTLGIAAHHFNWALDRLHDDATLMNKIAGALTAGHLIECGGQATGGNSYAEWPMNYSISDLGYPIAWIYEDGSCEITKPPGTGGRVTRDTIREQLVYEIHDPANYITPDGIVDLTAIHVRESGKDRVYIDGAVGKKAPENLKLAIGLMEGYISEQFFYFSWPYAVDKVKKFIEAAREIWARLPLKINRYEFQIVGLNGIHGNASPALDAHCLSDLPEAGVRVVIQHDDEKTGKMALGALTCLGLNGPPGIVAIPGWGKTNRLRLGLWPALIPKNIVNIDIDFIEF